MKFYNWIDKIKRTVAGLVIATLLVPNVAIAQQVNNNLNSDLGIDSPIVGLTSIGQPSFAAKLQTSLVPERATGSGTATFTRASTAYQEDFEGKRNLVLSGESRFQGARRVYNQVSSSEVFTGGGWTAVAGTNATLTPGQSDPLGGTSASTLTATAASGYLEYSKVLVSPAGTGANSVWLRRKTGTGIVKIYGPDGSVQQDISGSLTSSWKRFSITGILNTSRLFFYIFIITSGDAVDVAFVHLENVTGQANQNPSEYVSVGVLSAPYHGLNVDGIKAFNTLNGNTVASNVVTEATGAAIVTGAAGVAATAPVDAKGPFGYLSEGARADVLGVTAAIRRTMTDVGWVVGATMTVGAATGIDGVASAAASLTGGAVAATNTILYTTVLGASVKTYSVFVRRKTGTGTVSITGDAGVTWTPFVPTSMYQQFSFVTANVANPVVGFKIDTNLDAIEVDFNTLEVASFANPTPIPVNVSKAADVLTYPSAGNINGTVGTAYVEWAAKNAAGAGQQIIGASGAGTGIPMYLDNAPFEISLYDVTAERNFGVGPTVPTTSVQKTAVVWGNSAANGALNGILGTATAFDGDLNLGATISVGIRGDGLGSLFGTIRNVRIYPVALPSGILSIRTSTVTNWLGDPWWNMASTAANDETYRIAANL